MPFLNDELAAKFAAIGAGLSSGNRWDQQLGNAALGLQTQNQTMKDKAAQKQAINQTVQMLQAQSPELAMMVQNGQMSPADAYSMYIKQQQEKTAAMQPKYRFENVDGRLIRIDEKTGKLDELGNYSDPMKNAPAAAKENMWWSNNPDQYTAYRQRLQEEERAKNPDPIEERKRQAEAAGLKPDDPSYQSFLLTGKVAREDQQALTAVDKKAILDADELVSVNQSAIDALKQAKSISDKANSGWLSGARASVGANLPDWMVPDQISSPESSDATLNFDNAVVGQALTQLKAIFGGAPTEGERKILLDLQGSSNLPAKTREAILDRAIAAAERRLQFNQERANSLRGGTFYKSGQQNTNIGTTKSGISFTVEP